MGASCCSAEENQNDCKGCEETVVDCPICDGTDLADPAWWRGNDDGVESFIYIVHQILDDIEKRKEPVGSFGSKRMNMLRARLYEMYWVP